MSAFLISIHGQQARRRWMTLILFAALLLAAFQPSAPARADGGYAYYWSLTFDFESSANGSLYVAVGHNDNDAVQEPPIYAQTYAVPCTRKGNAGISGGLLKLDGGYLSCDLDIKSALEDAFAVCNTIVPGCHKDVYDVERYPNFRAMTEVMSANPGDAPIFYHEDASYMINPQSSSTQITASLMPHGVIPSTAVVSAPALNVMQNYTARYICDPGCEMNYGAAGSTEVVVTPNEDVQVYTASTTIYIGYDAATSLTAPVGTAIDTIFIDPPNYGND